MVPACALLIFFLDIVLFFGWRAEISTNFVLFFFALLFPLYFGWRAEKQRARLEQLADRLRRLYEHGGRPGLRVRRPRRLHLEMHQALRDMEKSLRTLERHHQIQRRRLRYPRLLIDDPKSVLDNMDQRLSRLEEVAALR